MTEIALEELAKKAIPSNANWQVLLVGGVQGSGSERVLTKYLGAQARLVTANIDGQCDVRADLSHAWPFQRGIFDLVISTWVLEHIREPKVFLHEAHGVLRDRGVLILAVPFIHRIHGSPFDYWRFTDTACRELVERAGFSQVDVIRIGGTPFLCAAAMLWFIFRIPGMGVLFTLLAAALDGILLVFTGLSGKGRLLVESFPISFVVVAYR